MKITIELTDEELHDILVTAGESGSGYWARTKVALREALREPVDVWDAEDGSPIGQLTREGLAGAATKMVTLARSDLVAQLLDDPAAMDADAADVLVQIALMGEIRYA